MEIESFEEIGKVNFQQLSPLQINNTTFEIVHNVKNLVVIFKNTLNWFNYINVICGRTVAKQSYMIGVIEINNSTKANTHRLLDICESAFESKVSPGYIDFIYFQNYIIGDNAASIGASDEEHNSVSEDDKVCQSVQVDTDKIRIGNVDLPRKVCNE